jgi:dihydroorotate dehydrogenase subfamily 1
VLRTSLFGIELQSPFILGSGPLSYSAQGMIRAHRAGAGAVVTKTIRDIPADNPYPHMAVAGPQSMINAEKWSDYPGERWVETEIPLAKKAGVVVIASIGHTEVEVGHWVAAVDSAGADIIELVSYDEITMLPMVRRAREITQKPILVKLSPNWNDPVDCALKALELGADGLTAMDSVGPVLRIDIRSGRPLVGGAGGKGWLTGNAIRPIVLHYVAELASKTDKPIIGIGGVMDAEDAVEMLMAGASAVGICTAPILKGVGYIATLCERLRKLIPELDAHQVRDLVGRALPYLAQQEIHTPFSFVFDQSMCTACMRCVKVCPYESRSLLDGIMQVDVETCRLCGICASVCPTGALGMNV